MTLETPDRMAQLTQSDLGATDLSIPKTRVSRT